MILNYAHNRNKMCIVIIDAITIINSFTTTKESVHY